MGYPCVTDCIRDPDAGHHWCEDAEGALGFCTPRNLIQALQLAKINDDNPALLTPYEYTDYADDSEAFTFSSSSAVTPDPVYAYVNPDQDPEGPADVIYVTPKDVEDDNEVVGGNRNPKKILPPIPTTTSSSTKSKILPASTTELDDASLEDKKDDFTIKAYTVYGEACRDECSNHDGYEYNWCTKVEESNVGVWRDADYCSSAANRTSHGEDCVDACEQRGYQYYWCHKNTNLWGYCTPAFLLEKLSTF